MNTLINGDARWSPHLVRIAEQLQTTVAYLTGETDDPDENAPSPPPEPAMQLVTMQVALPNRTALAAMFEAQLRVFHDLQGPELARELAKHLPNGLARLRAAPPIEDRDAFEDDDEADQAPPQDRRVAQEARRR